jgi:hypothetical protein
MCGKKKAQQRGSSGETTRSHSIPRRPPRPLGRLSGVAFGAVRRAKPAPLSDAGQLRVRTGKERGADPHLMG